MAAPASTAACRILPVIRESTPSGSGANVIERCAFLNADLARRLLSKIQHSGHGGLPFGAAARLVSKIQIQMTVMADRRASARVSATHRLRVDRWPGRTLKRAARP